MKNLYHFFRKLATFAAVLFMMPTMAQNTVVNVVEQKAQIERTSTLYVGEVLLDGHQSFYYLYSEDMTHTSTVLAAVRDCLQDFKGGVYSALVSSLEGENGLGIAVCSNTTYESMMNSNWTSAENAGLACLPNTTATSSSSDNLFETNADFADNCSLSLTSNGIDLVDDEGEPLAVSGVLGVLSSNSWDETVGYDVIDGQLVTLKERHINYNCESVTVIYTSVELESPMSFNPYTTPLTFEAVEAGTITVNLDDETTLEVIQYKLNDAEWTDVSWNTPIALVANDIISFRGDNGTCNEGDDTWVGFHFEPSNPVYVYGNMMSLIDKDDFATNITLTETYTFFHLFQRSDYLSNTAILNHPTKDIVLPATTLTANCYDGLFDGCPGITRAPELPATTLASWCYCMMFSGTGITTAPILPATILADNCYADMFMNCTNLTTAPDLPAAVLMEGCYSSMFAGCTSLNYVKCFATDISADCCTSGWMWNVAATGTFVKAVGMEDWTTGEDGIPEGWTVEDDPYTEPLTFEAMGTAYLGIKATNWSVSGLKSRKYTASTDTWSDWANINNSYYYVPLAEGDKLQFKKENDEAMADDYSKYYQFTSLQGSYYVYGNVMSLFGFATAVPEYACTKLFKGNTAIYNHETKELVLGATTLSKSCYGEMFSGCIHLTTAPALPATTLAQGCYYSMFYGCTDLATAPELPATTLVDNCYRSMFENCTSLTTAPDLPATTVQIYSYEKMFNGCTNLNYVKCLATEISEYECTTRWLNGVAATGTFVKAAAMNDWAIGPDADGHVNGIPEGWTVQNYSSFDPYTTPLTLEAISDGDITFVYTLSLYHDQELTDIEYQINGGTWTTYTWNNPIAVVAGDMVAFRGNNAAYNGNGDYESHIVSTADVYVYGNVMSLINSTGFAALTTLAGKNAFSNLFSTPGAQLWEVTPNTTIKSHPTKELVLPATTLTNMCYSYMFAGCQGLTRAPELPATEMTVACYASMFEGCTGLTEAPALPTTTFTSYSFDEVTFEEYGSIDCYMMMFKDCTSLTEAPALPATVLVHGVYQNMFQGCTSLEKAPELPAPIVADLAYSYMFDGCTSLNYVKCLATEFEINPEFGNTAEDNVMDWLNDVAATGTFVKAPEMTGWTLNSPNGIPTGWTIYDKIFQTEGDWNEAVNWNTNAVPADGSNVIIEANATIPSNCTANVGEISLYGATLTIEEGGQLYHTNTGVVATVEKTIAAYTPNAKDGWHLIGYSFADNTAVDEMTGLLENDYDLYYYDEPTHYWMNQEDAANNFTELEAGKGYLYANSQQVTLGLTGTLNAGNATVNIPLSYTEDNPLAGFNLVGNPFAHNVTSYAATNVAAEVYRMNDTKDNLMVSEVSASDPLLPGEGFFVKATDENASITFNARSTTANHEAITLDLRKDDLIVDRFMLKRDGEPLEKFTLNEHSTSIYATDEGKDWAVAVLGRDGACTVSTEIPVNFKAAKNGTYTLTTNVKGMDLDYLHLIDNLTGANIDLLSTPSYTFDAKIMDYASRFRLAFSAGEDADSHHDEAFAYISNGEIIVNTDACDASLQVIDALGRVIVLRRDGACTVSTEGMAPGVYVLRLINGENIKTQKIVVE